MKVAVTGSTGLIGRALVRSLRARGDDVVAFSRRPAQSFDQPTVVWNTESDDLDPAALDGVTALVNLAGVGIGDGRWSTEHRAAILSSRLVTTRKVVAAIRAQPHVSLISASAIGYYGSGDHEVDESKGPGTDFLADVCVRWEAAAMAAAEHSRVVLVRSGIVLAKDGGALSKMLRPTKMGLGGPLGSGTQWQSWIHLVDEVGLLLLAIDDTSLSGPMNATAPHPVTQRDFARELGHVLHRPSFFRVPAWTLKAAIGGASDLVLSGQRVVPSVALAHGYQFHFPVLAEALTDLVQPHG